MLDPKNIVNLTCGLVADPESVADGKILKFRVAVDFAGQEKGSDNKSGYFDVTYYNNGDNPNSKFVASQVEKQNFKKGTQLQILGRLVQERWETEKGKGQRAVIVAESMTYASSVNPNATAKPSSSSSGSDESPASLPTSF